jgi:hypothetical protein
MCYINHTKRPARENQKEDSGGGASENFLPMSDRLQIECHIQRIVVVKILEYFQTDRQNLDVNQPIESNSDLVSA